MITDAVREAKVSLGEYLRGLRRQCRIAPKDLAQKCNVKWRTIDRLERGSGKYTATLVKRFIKALAIDVSTVFPAIESYFRIIFPGDNSKQKRGPVFRTALA